nr:DUF4365 domain-containing protein [Saccharothrix longispora]
MRQVPNLLPSEWVERRVTNDYGVDLEVEMFREGRTEGSLLLLQVKGVQTTPRHDETWRFRMAVNGLEYAEMFTIPVILVVNPTAEDVNHFRFLWLQQYINVVLDHDQPNWRSQKTVTVKLPPENTFPTPRNISRWRHIARAPKRTRQLGLLAFHAHEFQIYAERFQLDDRNLDHLKELDLILDSVFALDTLFGADGWHWSRLLAATSLEEPRKIIKKILAGETIKASDLGGGYANASSAIGIDVEWLIDAGVHSLIFSVGNQLSSLVATANNYHLPRLNWLAHGDHDF